MSYRIWRNPLTNEQLGVVLDNEIWVPSDEANTDYQKYLEWLAEGNEPEEWNPDASN